MQRHRAHRIALRAEFGERGFETGIEIVVCRDQMERIGMQADFMAEVANFRKRVPHLRRSVPGLVQRMTMHDEKQPAQAGPIQDARHFDGADDVAMDVEFDMSEARILAFAGMRVGVVICAVARGELIDREQRNAGFLGGAAETRRIRSAGIARRRRACAGWSWPWSPSWPRFSWARCATNSTRGFSCRRLTPVVLERPPAIDGHRVKPPILLAL